ERNRAVDVDGLDAVIGAKQRQEVREQRLAEVALGTAVERQLAHAWLSRRDARRGAAERRARDAGAAATLRATRRRGPYLHRPRRRDPSRIPRRPRRRPQAARREAKRRRERRPPGRSGP